MKVKQTLGIIEENERNDEGVSKACFDDIYRQADPREYFRVLYGLDYVIPQLAKDVFGQLVAQLEILRGRPIKVLDLGCSYGTNAALLRHPLSLDRLAQRYSDLAQSGCSPQDIVALDRNYFRSWPRQDVSIVGLDASPPAIRYAREVGLLDDGLALDLEQTAPTAEFENMVRDVDLVISTGCVGYVGKKTFDAIAAAAKGSPWFASFVLRMYSFDEIEAAFDAKGYVTEKLNGVTFVQRRFASEAECKTTMAALEARGIDVSGKEAEGLLIAEFFLSRPKAESVPSIHDVAHMSSGEHFVTGRRYRRHSRASIVLAK